jgi:hypothetical protein
MRSLILSFLIAAPIMLSACANPFIANEGTPAGRPRVMRPNKPSSLVVGNYCGIGTKTGDLSARPVDRLDAACLEHDACFIEGRNRVQCNREMLAAAKAIIADPRSGKKLRRRAEAVRDFFELPLFNLFPYGMLPPRNNDVLKTKYRPPVAQTSAVKDYQ